MMPWLLGHLGHPLGAQDGHRLVMSPLESGPPDGVPRDRLLPHFTDGQLAPRETGGLTGSQTVGA